MAPVAAVVRAERHHCQGRVDALTCFSQSLTRVGVDTLAQVDRPLLERHLASGEQ